MTFEDLKNRLEDGTVLVFGKILNATHNVRGCGAMELDHRKGVRIVEQSLKQIRKAVTADGILILQIREDRLTPVCSFGEEVVTDLPEELEEETLQKLPRFDFSAKVHAQKVLRKLGYTV